MSGAVKHLQHLHEDHTLTFRQLKDALRAAANGELEEVTEKLDGMNLVFTWSDCLRVARGSGDLRSGGMTAHELTAKFSGRSGVEEAFTQAYEVLNQAVGALDDASRVAVFQGGRRWYSIEIVYPGNANVINYDANSLVFHRWPVYDVNPNGSVVEAVSDGADLLHQQVEAMQKALTRASWVLHKPALLQMRKMSSQVPLQRALHEIDTARDSVGLTDADTITIYLARCVLREIQSALGGVTPLAMQVVTRIVDGPGAQTLTQIKATAPRPLHATIKQIVDRGPEMVKRYRRPIEQAIYEFAVERLRGLSSILVKDGDSEISRIKQQVELAIKAARKLDAEQLMFVQKQLDRLGAIDNVTAPLEGIVFKYRGQVYKLTGAFAPVNQILGLFKYGNRR